MKLTLAWILISIWMILLTGCGQSEKQYIDDMSHFLNDLVVVRHEYNRGIEEIREWTYRSAGISLTTQEMIEHLEKSHEQFKNVQTALTDFSPPARFKLFQSSMREVLSASLEATESQIKYYSAVLKTGKQDKLLADQSSALLESFNKDFVQAFNIFAELTGQSDMSPEVQQNHRR